MSPRPRRHTRKLLTRHPGLARGPLFRQKWTPGSAQEHTYVGAARSDLSPM